MNNMLITGITADNFEKMKEDILSFIPNAILGAAATDPRQFLNQNLEVMKDGRFAINFNNPFIDCDWWEDENEQECILNPYYIQFARFAANLAKLSIKFDCDVAFDFRFEYTGQSDTGVSDVNIHFNSKTDRRLSFCVDMDDGSRKDGDRFPFEISGGLTE